MLLAATDWDAVGAVVGIAGFAIAFGGVVGRQVLGWLHRRTTQRGEELQMRQAITGRPATAYTPREPGLIEITAELQKGHKELALANGEVVKAVTELQQTMVEHRREDVELAEQMHEHIRASAEAAHKAGRNGDGS